MTPLRPSRVLREIREERPATCLKINITHPAVIELAGLAGASAVWLCNEHVPNDWRDLEHCVRAAKLHDMDAIVRICKGSYSDYLKPFEADATGIMVPHVASGGEARAIVDMCRFFPLGRRALDGGNVDGKFCQIPTAEYIAASNRERFLIFQVESPEAVENIDEIAAVDGYDFLLFGPGDYAHRIGQAGNVRHPEVLAAREKVEQAARRFGRKLFAVAAGGSPSEQWERGYALLNVGSDVWSLGETFRASVAAGSKPSGASSYKLS
jgi:4-hydroxy-2-oxoheptanedioate aldolase